MDDKELIEALKAVEDTATETRRHARAHIVKLAAARLTALAEENERLRKAIRDAHVALGADGGITEIECSCEFCSEVPR